MSQKVNVKVNDSHVFDIDSETVKDMDCIETKPRSFHLIDKNKSYQAEIINANFNKKTYQVKVNNTSYKITILNTLDLLIKDMGFAVGTTKQINSIKAPMPGLILDINIKVGQKVMINDPLLILEAMKMENSITSPRDGIIKSVSANKGDAVEKNQLLIEFEN